MALKLEEIRALASRVAGSYGLEVVDVEYQGGGGKHRTLRVFIEKNEAERAKLRERVARLQAEVSDAELEQGLAGEEGGASPADWTDEGEADAAFADAAFLDGLPSVTNLELLSGVTHEDCEAFSRDFGVVLDVEELGPGTEYLLEVSSPGLDRRLTRVEEYRRFTGSLVKVQTFEAVGGSRHWQGRLASVDGDRVVLEVTESRAGKAKKKTAKRAAQVGAESKPVEVAIRLGNVEKAQLVPEF